MRTSENFHLFWEDTKQKVTNLDVDAPKLHKQRRAPTKTEEYFGEKQCMNTPMMLFPTIVEYILNP